MRLLRYIQTSHSVYKEIKKQKEYNKAFLVPYLHELENKYDGKFSDEQKKKILNYYGIFITSFLCCSYKKLYGKILSTAERKRATFFGIFTPVGDDLFDEDKLDTESISCIIFNPEDYTATTFLANVAKETQTFLLADVPHKECYRQAIKNVLNIQIETARQTDPAISVMELEHITFTKGAFSVLYYHQCLDDVVDEQMKDVLFLTGSLFQLGNDIFDLYKDVRDNIYTLANTCTDFVALRESFLERVNLQNKKIMALSYPKKKKEEFCFIMNSINARSLVALDKFVKMQKKTGDKINWWQLQRKDMIVDMETPWNFLKWLYYSSKLSK